MSLNKALIKMGANPELVRTVLKNPLRKEGDTYSMKQDMANKYEELGFTAKANKIRMDATYIAPPLDPNYLWVCLNLSRISVKGNRDQRTHLRGITLNEHRRITRSGGWFREPDTVIWCKALVLIPNNLWLGDLPQGILDFTYKIKNDFEAFYVAVIIEGKNNYGSIVSNLNNVLHFQKNDPILLGSKSPEELQNGPNQLAVLGVWGKDWHEINLS